MISDGKMLSLSIPAGQVSERVGPDGAVFGYEFTVDEPGDYALWVRIGYEWVRSPFDWRLDAGPWKTVPSTVPTVNVVGIARWNELAWLDLGRANLAKGKHTLSFRHAPYTAKDNKGNEKPGRILHSLDAICIAKGEFRPNGHRKPGVDDRGDADRKAAETVFELPADGSDRPSVQLDGLWETARWDEEVYDPATRLEGPAELPDLGKLHWEALRVPGNRRKLKPEHEFAHRYLMRTHVKVPESMKDRGFVLDFDGFRMIAGVFVNGKPCGWSRDFSAEWQCDVSSAIKPGEVNEIVVAMKSDQYAIQPERDKGNARAEALGLRSYVNVPWSMRTHQSLGHLYDMPVASGHDSGLYQPVRLKAVGKAWVEDVYAIPSFKDKKLGLEVTVKNAADEPVNVTVENEVRRWSKQGLAETPEKTFPAKSMTVPAGKTETIKLSEPWAKPALWFPDDPNLYTVVTRIKADGRLIDTKETRFGFREITSDGQGFYINGVPWQFWTDIDNKGSVQAFIANAKESGKNFGRYWNGNGWKQTPTEVFDALDEAGIMVRDSGVFDGQMINYGPGLAEGSRDDRTYYRPLFEHIAEQARAQVRARRNHPSILYWTFENEITFINVANLGMTAYVEPGIRWVAEEIMKVDPTRLAGVDGGRALSPPNEWKNAPADVVALGPLPINGCHYNARPFGEYPDAGYSNEYWMTHRHRNKWLMTPDRPIVHGEIFFANGYQPSQLAQLGGEACFIGPSEAWPARDLMQRFLFEGMRYSNSSHGMHTWTGRSTRDYWHAWSPVAVFIREWDRAFGSGQTVKRTLPRHELDVQEHAD